MEKDHSQSLKKTKSNILVEKGGVRGFSFVVVLLMELLSEVDGVIIPGDKVGKIGGIDHEEIVSLRLGAGLSQKKEVSRAICSFSVAHLYFGSS
jgi:hypothetical protein